MKRQLVWFAHMAVYVEAVLAMMQISEAETIL